MIIGPHKKGKLSHPKYVLLTWRTTWTAMSAVMTIVPIPLPLRAIQKARFGKKEVMSSRKPIYPPSPKSRTKKQSKVTQADYLSRSQKLHDSYIQRPPVWASCCGDCSRCWQGTWSWRGWKWLIRKLPFLLAFAMLLCGAVCAATRPQTGIWALEAGGYKFGGLGWCDSREPK